LSVARVGIVGVGLIGGSIALRARAARWHVIGFDRDAATVTRALARGALDASAPDLESLAAACDTLVVALPVDATGEALEALAGQSGPALIIDVASVKAPLVERGRGVAHYVGTHPMAGRERGGIDAAQADLFEQATWAHSPHPDRDLVAKTRAFIAAMGAIPLEIEPGEHDAIVALTSHLPQVLSVLLGAELSAAAEVDRRVTSLCGPGMMSMLRLAHSPAATWSPIVAANGAPLAERLRSIGRALDSAATCLEAGDAAPLMSYFELARKAAMLLEERFPTTGRSSAYP
jgi:prephenate dehydrogenase